MPPGRRQRWIGGALLALLALSLAGNVYLYPRATRPLYEAYDRPLIEQTIARAALTQRTDAETLRAYSFPIVFRLPGRTCVEMRNIDGSGFYGACYDRSGRVTEEIAGTN